MDEMTELKNMVKINQNLMEIPPIEQLHNEGGSGFQHMSSLDDSKFEKSVSMSVYSDGSYGIVKGISKKEKIKEAIKIEKKRGDIKGEIKLIKMAINKKVEEEDIKESLTHTLNKLSEIKEFFETHDDLLNGKNNESLIVEKLGETDLGEFSEWQ